MLKSFAVAFAALLLVELKAIQHGPTEQLCNCQRSTRTCDCERSSVQYDAAPHVDVNASHLTQNPRAPSASDLCVLRCMQYCNTDIAQQCQQTCQKLCNQDNARQIIATASQSHQLDNAPAAANNIISSLTQFTTSQSVLEGIQGTQQTSYPFESNVSGSISQQSLARMAQQASGTPLLQAFNPTTKLSPNSAIQNIPGTVAQKDFVAPEQNVPMTATQQTPRTRTQQPPTPSIWTLESAIQQGSGTQQASSFIIPEISGSMNQWGEMNDQLLLGPMTQQAPGMTMQHLPGSTIQRAPEPTNQEIPQPLTQQSPTPLPLSQRFLASALEQTTRPIIQLPSMPIIQSSVEPLVQQALQPTTQQASGNVVLGSMTRHTMGPEAANVPGLVLQQVPEPVIQQTSESAAQQRLETPFRGTSAATTEQLSGQIMQQSTGRPVQQISDQLNPSPLSSAVQASTIPNELRTISSSMPQQTYQQAPLLPPPSSSQQAQITLPQSIQESPKCAGYCKESCMQQCIWQRRLSQCSPSCAKSCDQNCVLRSPLTTQQDLAIAARTVQQGILQSATTRSVVQRDQAATVDQARDRTFGSAGQDEFLDRTNFSGNILRKYPADFRTLEEDP
uniref:Uncharacterized protein n=1 Tax=Ascaris lumbricoides TaxID=6252 RepID=A0A0M3IEX7_ASCLU